jgi:hypothetical protein
VGVQDNLNTTENIQVNRPTGANVPTAQKEWDDMTAEEQAAERAKAQKEIASANKPDPTKDREIDRVLGHMKKVFGEQKRHPIILYQINGAMKAAGHKDLTPVQLGINGYNFVIPRGVPVQLPEDAIKILYQSGEITPQTMLTLGLASQDELMADLNAANEIAAQIQAKLAPMEM